MSKHGLFPGPSFSSPGRYLFPIHSNPATCSCVAIAASTPAGALSTHVYPIVCGLDGVAISQSFLNIGDLPGLETSTRIMIPHILLFYFSL
jgi:hypothetical protein